MLTRSRQRGTCASDGERSNAIFSFSWAQRLQSVDRHHVSAVMCVCVKCVGGRGVKVGGGCAFARESEASSVSFR